MMKKKKNTQKKTIRARNEGLVMILQEKNLKKDNKTTKHQNHKGYKQKKHTSATKKKEERTTAKAPYNPFLCKFKEYSTPVP